MNENFNNNNARQIIQIIFLTLIINSFICGLVNCSKEEKLLGIQAKTPLTIFKNLQKELYLDLLNLLNNTKIPKFIFHEKIKDENYIFEFADFTIEFEYELKNNKEINVKDDSSFSLNGSCFKIYGKTQNSIVSEKIGNLQNNILEFSSKNLDSELEIKIIINEDYNKKNAPLLLKLTKFLLNVDLNFKEGINDEDLFFNTKIKELITNKFKVKLREILNNIFSTNIQQLLLIKSQKLDFNLPFIKTTTQDNFTLIPSDNPVVADDSMVINLQSISQKNISINEFLGMYIERGYMDFLLKVNKLQNLIPIKINEDLDKTQNKYLTKLKKILKINTNKDLTNILIQFSFEKIFRIISESREILIVANIRIRVLNKNFEKSKNLLSEFIVKVNFTFEAILKDHSGFKIFIKDYKIENTEKSSLNSNNSLTQKEYNVLLNYQIINYIEKINENILSNIKFLVNQDLKDKILRQDFHLFKGENLGNLKIQF